MKTIRQSAFETNSSSSHSITVNEKTVLFDSITPDDMGIIDLFGGEFGWTWEKFNDPLTKANYCAVDVANDETLKEMLVEVIKSHTGARGVEFRFTSDYDSDNRSYIDHQSTGTSIGDGRSKINVFQDRETLKNFIFNRNSWLFTGNDNSSPSINFYDDADTINNMTHYIELDGSDERGYLDIEDAVRESSVQPLIHTLFESNQWNKHGESDGYGLRDKSDCRFHIARMIGFNGIDLESKTLCVQDVKSIYDGDGNYKGEKILETKFLKFRIVSRRQKLD